MLSLGAPAAAEEAGGFITLWTVERQRPFVHTSYKSPMLTTNALGRGSTGSHSPEVRRTFNGREAGGEPGEEVRGVAVVGQSLRSISYTGSACLQAAGIDVAHVGFVLMEDCEARVVSMLAVANGRR